MIELTLKGFVKYVTAGDAAKRTVLQDFKYPDDDEPRAMRMYYRDARDRIEAYHRNPHPAEWLEAKALDLSSLAALNSGSSATRLRNNARALRSYQDSFSGRSFELLSPVRLPLEFGAVRIKVTPDLHVREKQHEKIVRLEFSKNGLKKDAGKVMSQCLFEAATRNGLALKSSDVLILDVFDGREIRGARAGGKMLRDIEATCEVIEAIWDRIEPPVRRRRP